MNDFDYEGEAEIRQMIADWIERDSEEGIEQYARHFASMVGLKEFFDWPPSERKAVYAVHPPVDLLTGLPPVDQLGIFPQYTALAGEFQDYYVRMVKDWRGMING